MSYLQITSAESGNKTKLQMVVADGHLNVPPEFVWAFKSGHSLYHPSGGCLKKDTI